MTPHIEAECRTLAEFHDAARARLDRVYYDFFAGGAGDEWTLRENRLAYDRWVVRPRVLTDVSHVDCSATVLGTAMDAPILVSPSAFQRLAHPEGDKPDFHDAVCFAAHLP